MTILQAIIFGLIQGIGEFLPISSTAHIILLPWLLGWQDPGNVFDVALHLGTAAAVILFFLPDWIRLIRAGLTDPKSKDGRMFWTLVVATIPGGIVGLLLDGYMEHFRNPALIAVMLIIMGVILYIADRVGQRAVDFDHIDMKKGLGVGLSQALAIIPGVSRSGITMSVGRMLGIERAGIAKFTFLMATPIILADGLYHIKDLDAVPIDTVPFIIAVLTSAIAGAASIKFLLEYLRTKSFGIFAWYRVIFGLIILGVNYMRSLSLP